MKWFFGVFFWTISYMDKQGKFLECFILVLKNPNQKPQIIIWEIIASKVNMSVIGGLGNGICTNLRSHLRHVSYTGHFQLHKQVLRQCGANCGLSHLARNCEWSCITYLKNVISNCKKWVKMEKLSMWRFHFFLLSCMLFSLVFSIKIKSVVVCCAHPMRIKNI